MDQHEIVRKVDQIGEQQPTLAELFAPAETASEAAIRLRRV